MEGPLQVYEHRWDSDGGKGLGAGIHVGDREEDTAMSNLSLIVYGSSLLGETKS